MSPAEAVATAGVPVGYGLGSIAGFRFARWLIEFVFRRMDVRNARFTAKEQALETRYDQRLRHLEEELARTQKAMTLLLNDVARRDSANPILQRVAELLHPLDQALPMNGRVAPDPALDDLCRSAKREGEQ